MSLFSGKIHEMLLLLLERHCFQIYMMLMLDNVTWHGYVYTKGPFYLRHITLEFPWTFPQFQAAKVELRKTKSSNNVLFSSY